MSNCHRMLLLAVSLTLGDGKIDKSFIASPPFENQSSEVVTSAHCLEDIQKVIANSVEKYQLLLSSTFEPLVSEELPTSISYENELQEPSIKEKISQALEEPGAILFTPPAGWFVADTKLLPPRVKVMVVGKGATEFPPSLNLGMETYQGTVKEYLKTVKAINDAQNAEWKNLGQIKTKAGNANLSQVDMKCEWGNLRLMHVILKKEDMLYVLTAAALKDEFSRFYKDFFTAMQSLRFNKDALEMIPAIKKRNQLQKACRDLREEWVKRLNNFQIDNPQLSSKEAREKLFVAETFHNECWNSFLKMLADNFGEMGTKWQEHMKTKMQNELVAETKSKKK